VLAHGFAGGLEETNADTHLSTGPSQAVCRRIGMEHRGITDLWYDEPSQHYCLTRSDWERQQARAAR
jgi:RimJ/RimL family protein N-acetyltransferase